MQQPSQGRTDSAEQKLRKLLSYPTLTDHKEMLSLPENTIYASNGGDFYEYPDNIILPTDNESGLWFVTEITKFLDSGNYLINDYDKMMVMISQHYRQLIDTYNTISTTLKSKLLNQSPLSQTTMRKPFYFSS